MVPNCLFSSQMFILLLLWSCNQCFFHVYFGLMPFIIIKRGGLGLEMELGSGECQRHWAIKGFLWDEGWNFLPKTSLCFLIQLHLVDSQRSCWFPAQILSRAVRIQSKTGKILQALPRRRRKMATSWKQTLLRVRSLLPTKVSLLCTVREQREWSVWDMCPRVFCG